MASDESPGSHQLAASGQKFTADATNAAEPRLPTHANRNEARRGFASIDGLQYRRQPVLIPGGVKNSDWRPWGCEPILRA